MMLTNTKEPSVWLTEWFRRRVGIAHELSKDEMEQNYFEAGWIDSLAIMDLIHDTEQYFRVRFNERHFQDRRFSTLSGLATILTEMAASKCDTGSQT